MKMKYLVTIGAMAAVLATQTATAQFFTNDLTDATSVLTQFNTNCAPDGIFGFSTNNVITVLNPTNTTMTVSRTNITAGASVFATSTNDNDAVRSYLATQFGGYSTNGWKARVSLETPVSGDPSDNYVFIGMGKGVPSGSNNEPVDGDRAYVRWRHGSGASYGRPRTYLNGSAIETSGTAANSIGADVLLTYLANTGTLTFEIYNWNSDGSTNAAADITMSVDASALTFSDIVGATNTEARIFFGGNATITFSDFSVKEYIPTAPTAPLNLYAWPNSNDIVTVWWDEEVLSDSYKVYRSVENEDNYIQIGTGVTNTTYVDTDVTNGVVYYYEVSGVNDFGEGSLSESDSAVPNQYLIIGTDGTYGGNPYITKHNLFDGDITTYFDADATGSWGGLDFGAGNEQELVEIRYTMRNWGSAKDRTIGAEIQGANFDDFSDAVTLYTVTTNDLTYPNANIITVSNSTPFRYVRMLSNATRPLYGVAELEFLTEADFTTNGTLKAWLDDYYDVSGANPEGFADYEAADLSDTDMDGLKAYEEYQLGTDPTDPLDPAPTDFSITGTTVAGSDLILTWESSAGQSFSVMTNGNLADTNGWGAAAAGITGEAGSTSYTGTVSEATLFYQVTTP